MCWPKCPPAPRSGSSLRLAVRPLRGPNPWAACPVLEAALDPSAPANLAATLAGRVLQLQQDAGARVSFSAVAPDETRFAVEFEEEEVAREALDLALAGADEAALARLRALHDRLALGPNTRALFDAARRRSIPVRRLDRGSLLQLGHGCRQRRLCGAETDLTSSIGEGIGWDKPVAKAILQAIGVPTPAGRLVTSAQDACCAAAGFGATVVVKPESANHGRAVFIGISRAEAIRGAYEAARLEGESGKVLVERFIPGAEHRVLVVDGRVAAAARGEALYVTGDGVGSVAQLMDEVNRDPRRGDAADCPLSPVELDQVTRAVLAQQDLTGESVPAIGTAVLIQRNGNLGLDVTAQVHPDNAELLSLAARAIGLDIAGIDLVVGDIGRPLREQGGAILEVNAMPGLLMHLKPASGQPRRVDDAIIASLYPPGTDSRIPIYAVEAGPDSSRLARLLAARLTQAGLVTGVACAEGTFVQDQLTRPGDCATPQHAADLLLHPLLEAAVFEVSLPSILEEGLGFDRCDVLVLSPSHPDSDARRTLRETLSPAGRLIVPAPEESPEALAARAAASLHHRPGTRQ